MIKVCARCGGFFEPVKHAGGRQKYCLPCRAEATKERRRRARLRAKLSKQASLPPEPVRSPNRDCFAFVSDDHCDALQLMECKWKACGFYKPMEEAVDDE